MDREKKIEGYDAHNVSSRPEQPLKDEKGTVPGQQIGLYGKANKKDVRQVVKILNPDVDSMESRG